MECLPDAFYKSLLNTSKPHILDICIISLLCMYQLWYIISTYQVVSIFYYLLSSLNSQCKFNNNNKKAQQPQSYYFIHAVIYCILTMVFLSWIRKRIIVSKYD